MADFICILCKLPKPDRMLSLGLLFSTLQSYKNCKKNFIGTQVQGYVEFCRTKTGAKICPVNWGHTGIIMMSWVSKMVSCGRGAGSCYLPLYNVRSSRSYMRATLVLSKPSSGHAFVCSGPRWMCTRWRFGGKVASQGWSWLRRIG